MSAAPLTANGSIPPRPGNAFDLYKEKLRVLGEFLQTDTSTAAMRKLWNELPKDEKTKLTLEAKEKRDAFDKKYPNWRNRAPKNREVSARMEELRSSAQLPRVAHKMSLSAGMPVASSQAPARRVFHPAIRMAAVPPPHPHHHQYPWIQSPRAPPQYGANLQHPEPQPWEQQENQEPARMWVPRNVTQHRYNPY